MFIILGYNRKLLYICTTIKRNDILNNQKTTIMTFTFTFTSKFEIGDIVTTQLSDEPRTIVDIKLGYKYNFLYLLADGNGIWVSEDFLTLIEPSI
jgi:hypothetical protein